MTKKIFSLLLVLLIAAVPYMALAQVKMVSGPVEVDLLLEDTPIGTSILHKGEVYGSFNEYLLRRKGDSNEMEAIAKFTHEPEKLDENGNPEKVEGALISDGEQLYLVNSTDVYRLNVEGTVAKAELLLKTEENADSTFYDNYSALIKDGVLYRTSISNEGEMKLHIRKLGEGGEEQIPLTEEQGGYPMALGRYRDSIYVITNSGILVLENNALKTIYQKEEEDRGTNPVYCYIESEDAFYEANQSYLSRIKDGKAEHISVLDYYINTLLPLHDGTLLMQHEKGFETLTPSTAKMPEKVLRVVGLEDQSVITSYNKAHPEMPAVRVQTDFNGPQSFGTEMKSENKSDVYFLDIYLYVDALLKHEYLEPLNGNAALMEMAGRMYPYVRESITKDDKVYMMPINIYNYGFEAKLNNYAYNIRAWGALGLTENDVPKTYMEFVKLLDRLYNEKQDAMQSEKLGLYETPFGFMEELKLRVLNLVAVNAAKKGEAPKYNTPEMAALLEAINNSEYLKEDRENENLMDEVSNSTDFLFKETEDIVDLPDGCRLMPLTIGADDQPCTLATASVMFVNALSENKEQAMTFLQHTMEHLSEHIQAYLYTDKNEPVINQNAVKSIERVEREIAKMDEEIAKDKENGGKNVKRLEQEKKTTVQGLTYLKNRTYLISEEELKALKEKADNIFIVRNELFAWHNEQMRRLMNRFYENSIQPEEFLSELDRMVNMMMQEQN